MKKLLVYFALMLAVTTGCQDADLEGKLPKADFSIGSLKIEAATGSYTWAEGGKTDEAHKKSSSALANDLAEVEIAENDSIKLNFSRKPKKLEVSILSGEKEISPPTKAENQVFVVPSLPPGSYSFLVDADFDNGNAEYVFNANAIELEKTVSSFAYPQLLPQERHTYSMLAVGRQNDKEPIENNKKIIAYVNEILSLENSKQAKAVYPAMKVDSDPCFILFSQEGPVFQSGDIEEVAAYIEANKP